MPILLKGCKSDLCAVLSEVSRLSVRVYIDCGAIWSKNTSIVHQFQTFYFKKSWKSSCQTIKWSFFKRIVYLKSFSQDLECRMAQKLHQLKSYGLLTINCLACKTSLHHSISLTKYVTAEIRTHCLYQEYCSESHVSHM